MPTCSLRPAPHRATSASEHRWSLDQTLENAASWKQEVFALSDQMVSVDKLLSADLTASRTIDAGGRIVNEKAPAER
jgi:hypothetical protein